MKTWKHLSAWKYVTTWERDRALECWRVVPIVLLLPLTKMFYIREASDQKFLSSAKMFSFCHQKRPPPPKNGKNRHSMTNNSPQNVWPSWRQEESFGSCCRFCRSLVTQCNVGQEHREINAQEWAPFLDVFWHTLSTLRKVCSIFWSFEEPLIIAFWELHFCAKRHAPWLSILTIVIDGKLFWRQGHHCPDYLKNRILQYAK